MRTLRRITAATALAATALVSPAHADPPPPEQVPPVECTPLRPPVRDFCQLVIGDNVLLRFTDCYAQRVDLIANADEAGWLFVGGVAWGEYVTEITTHCYLGSIDVSSRREGQIGYLDPQTATGPVGEAGNTVCQRWLVRFADDNPLGLMPGHDYWIPSDEPECPSAGIPPPPRTPPV
jgi:hypothetical protein